MAWRDCLNYFVDNPELRTYFFNVSQSVGWYARATRKAAANKLTDMMLVAYFLQYYFRVINPNDPIAKQDEWDSIPLPGLIPEMMMADRSSTINNLSYWIRIYQEGSSPACVIDGRVDPHKYGLNTIALLNLDFKNYVQNSVGREDWMEFMINDQPMLMPVQLKQELAYDPFNPV